MAQKPDAFLSYTRFDDEEGEISAFRERLSRTVRQVSGEPFAIFQDVDDDAGIALGERWKDKLDEMLDQTRFFIPILTPSFFRSEPCRQELRTFLDLEQKVGRRDLVLPIYWITCPVLEEVYLKAKDELAQIIDDRQRWDWRELIFEDLTSAACRNAMHSLATQIARARRLILRVATSEETSPLKVKVPSSAERRIDQIKEISTLEREGSDQEERSSKDTVFVSYSRRDDKWLKEIKKIMSPILKSDIINFWDDTKIKPGSDWEIEIDNALNISKAAILIVTPDFLDSDFIKSNELPKILESKESQGLKVFWIATSHSLFDFTEIRHFQCVNDPQNPLDCLEPHDQRRTLVECGRKIASALGIQAMDVARRD